MGGGSYSYLSSKTRSTSMRSKTREEIFTQHSMNHELNIKNKVRECCDSEEHPNTTPIIIGLDVTGSMGRVPHDLITGVFPEIMKRIMDAGVTDPQVCFVAIGDHYTDNYPIQVGQFEASDELLEKWLKMIYLEGGGGGNDGETYSLAWYFASRHTKCDAFIKGRKGILITIGDEPFHKTIDKKSIHRLFGDTLETDITTSKLYEEASKNWNITHINVNDWSSSFYKDKLNINCAITTESESTKEIGELISKIVINNSTKSDIKVENSEQIIL